MAGAHSFLFLQFDKPPHKSPSPHPVQSRSGSCCAEMQSPGKLLRQSWPSPPNMNQQKVTCEPPTTRRPPDQHRTPIRQKRPSRKNKVPGNCNITLPKGASMQFGPTMYFVYPPIFQHGIHLNPVRGNGNHNLVQPGWFRFQPKQITRQGKQASDV